MNEIITYAVEIIRSARTTDNVSPSAVVGENTNNGTQNPTCVETAITEGKIILVKTSGTVVGVFTNNSGAKCVSYNQHVTRLVINAAS